MDLRVVYDTNVVVSGTLVPSSIPASLIAFALQGAVQLYLSPEIVDEYHDGRIGAGIVLHQPGKAGITRFLTHVSPRTAPWAPSLRSSERATPHNGVAPQRYEIVVAGVARRTTSSSSLK